MMKKIVASNLLILLLCAVGFWAYRGHKNQQVTHTVQRLSRPLLFELSAGEYVVKQYEGAGSQLWTDRSYHTEEPIDQLVGWNYVSVARDSQTQYALQIKAPTTLYTLGNKAVPNNYTDWELTDWTVLVRDSYEPRQFDGIYKREVSTGTCVINFQATIPAPPVFFDPLQVNLLQ